MGELGICDKKQYEHAGPHERITDSGGMMPPFGCLNWKSVAQPESQPQQDGTTELEQIACMLEEIWGLPESAATVRRAEAALTQVRVALGCEQVAVALIERTSNLRRTYIAGCESILASWSRALAATQPGKEGKG